MRGLNVILSLGLALGAVSDECTAHSDCDAGKYCSNLMEDLAGLTCEDALVCMTSDSVDGKCPESGAPTLLSEDELPKCITTAFATECVPKDILDTNTEPDLSEICNCVEGLDRTDCDKTSVGEIEEAVKTCEELAELHQLAKDMEKAFACEPLKTEDACKKKWGCYWSDDICLKEQVPVCVVMDFFESKCSSATGMEYCNCYDALDKGFCDAKEVEAVEERVRVCKKNHAATEPSPSPAATEPSPSPAATEPLAPSPGLTTGAGTGSGGLAPGAIAGIVIGVLIGLPLLGYGGYMLWSKYN